MERKKGITLTLIAVCVFALAVVGATYAWWKLTRVQNDENVVSGACLDFDLTSQSSGINLASAWPVMDSEGKEGPGYTFKVTNNCDEDVDYNVELVESSGSEFPEKYIRFNLDYVQNSNVMKTRMDSVGYMDEGSNGRILDTYTVEANGENSHTLKLWIDEYAPVGYQSKDYISKVNIVAGQGIKAPKIIASETVDGNDPVKYTWYDNGDLFAELLNDQPYTEDYMSFLSYLINKYVQEDPDEVFADATGQAEQTYLQNYYDSHEGIPIILFFSIVDKPNQAYYMSVGVDNAVGDGSASIIESMTNQSFKEDLYDSIDDETLAGIFQKLSDNMPRFKNIYINAPAGIPYNFMVGTNANRLSINFLDGDDAYHPFMDYAFAGVSLNSIDLRAHSDVDFNWESFGGLYAPNATLIIPDVETSWSLYPFINAYVDTVEITSKNDSYSQLWIIEDFTYLKKIIIAGELNEVRTLPSQFADHFGIGVQGAQLSNVDFYVRGPQKEIENLTPSAYKGGVVHWDYYN